MARTRTLSLQLKFDLRLDGVDAEVFPTMLDLDIRQSKSVLKRPRHLKEVLSACCILSPKSEISVTLDT
jgi:hypothetical protein